MPESIKGQIAKRREDQQQLNNTIGSWNRTACIKAAKQPSTGTDTLSALLKWWKNAEPSWDNREVGRRVASHPNTSPSDLDSIYQDFPEDVARNPNTLNSTRLKILEKCPEWSIDKVIGRNCIENMSKLPLDQEITSALIKVAAAMRCYTLAARGILNQETCTLQTFGELLSVDYELDKPHSKTHETCRARVARQIYNHPHAPKYLKDNIANAMMSPERDQALTEVGTQLLKNVQNNKNGPSKLPT